MDSACRTQSTRGHSVRSQESSPSSRQNNDTISNSKAKLTRPYGRSGLSAPKRPHRAEILPRAAVGAALVPRSLRLFLGVGDGLRCAWRQCFRSLQASHGAHRIGPPIHIISENS
eukprot:1182963-Prorocentrum_minimum.AAC.3